MELFTPRNVAKFVVQAAISQKTAQLAETVITDHTQLEEDNTVVGISCHVIGWYASHKLQPYTDKMIDKIADKLVARKEKKNQKDTAE